MRKLYMMWHFKALSSRQQVCSLVFMRKKIFCIGWQRVTHAIEVRTERHGDYMNQKERVERQENLNKYNSITHKVKPENQNQTHNVRKEGIQPINQKR